MERPCKLNCKIRRNGALPWPGHPDSLRVVTRHLGVMPLLQLNKVSPAPDTRPHRRRPSSEDTDGFLATFAHEVRGPLAVVIGLAETLRSRGRELDTEAVDDLLARVVRAARSADRMTTDLVAGSVGAPRSESRSRVDLADCAADVVAACPDVELKSLDPCAVFADRLRIAQIVSNLLSNARTHGPRGGAVRVTARRTDPWAVLEVTDEGPGIPALEQARMFERFARRPGSPGHGIGLWLSREIARSHGGDMEVAAGAPTTVRLRLPLAGRGASAGTGATVLAFSGRS